MSRNFEDLSPAEQARILKEKEASQGWATPLEEIPTNIPPRKTQQRRVDVKQGPHPTNQGPHFKQQATQQLPSQVPPETKVVLKNESLLLGEQQVRSAVLPELQRFAKTVGSTAGP